MVDCRSCQFASSDFIKNLTIARDIYSENVEFSESEVEARFPHIFEDILRCSVQPSGPVNGQCVHYDPYPKQRLVIRFKGEGKHYSCLASDLGLRQEITLLLNLIVVGVIYAKRKDGDTILQGAVLPLEEIEFASFLNLYPFLRDIKSQGAETLYIDLT